MSERKQVTPTGEPYFRPRLNAYQNQVITLIDQAQKEGKPLPAPEAIAAAVGIPILTEADELLGDLKARRAEAKANQFERKYKTALNELERLSDALDSALLIKESVAFDRLTPAPLSDTLGEVIPMVQWSDWHVEEKVEPRTIDGLNEYNPDIAAKRAYKLAQNTLKLTQKERKNACIREMLLTLGGDMINNHLHDHDVRNNYLSPIEAVRFAKELLIKNITFLLEYGDFDKLTIACVRGNHSRQTHKMSATDDYRLNYEQMLYYDLRDYFNRQNAPIEWHIPQGGRAYVEKFGRVVRVFHGWEVKGGGGIGGITIPLWKTLHRYDSIQKADFSLMHDKHTYWAATPHSQINGSMVGYNAYARSCGFPYQPPIQGMKLLDKKRGFTGSFPIFCE